MQHDVDYAMMCGDSVECKNKADKNSKLDGCHSVDPETML